MWLNHLYFEKENLMANTSKITIELLLAIDDFNIPDPIVICKPICQRTMLLKIEIGIQVDFVYDIWSFCSTTVSRSPVFFWRFKCP